MAVSLSPLVFHARQPALVFVAFAMLLTACGPELTTPARTNVSGDWTAAGPAAGLTDISIHLAQSADGSITGSYAATGTKPTQFCPPDPPCQISGTISGTNTVLEVYFELKDAGQFSGQLITGTRLRGSMARISSIGPLEFSRVLNTTTGGP